MPEIGYWKYVRFTDDEPQYWGTDDDITIIFDSADDRLEYKMKKDIRFEDDVGNEILTLDKVNRHVEIPVQLNVAALEEYAVGAGITVKGSLTFSGADLDLAGNLLKNPKLGTILNTNDYAIAGKSGNTGRALIGGGSDGGAGTGGSIELKGNAVAGEAGRIYYMVGKVSGAMHMLYSWNAALTTNLRRLRVTDGDTADIDITNAYIDFEDQSLEATAGALQGYVIMKVGGAKFKFPAYALT